MPGATILRGETRVLADSASHAIGTFNSDPYWLPEGGYQGVVFTIIVTDVGSGGSVDTVNIQAESGGNFDTVSAATGLGLTATGRYRIRIAPGAANAAGYTYQEEDVVPSVGRVQVVHTGDAVIYSISVEAL